MIYNLVYPSTQIMHCNLVMRFENTLKYEFLKTIVIPAYTNNMLPTLFFKTLIYRFLFELTKI